MRSAAESVRLTTSFALLMGFALAGPARAQTAGEASVVEVRGGSAAFTVETNISAISVHGKSNALTARLRRPGG